jgi:dTDP-4-amino-4,6-dideoxygalactose transaminase
MDRIQIAVPNLGSEEIEAIRGPIQTGWLTQGPYVKEFEKNFAAKHRVNYALATTSCTTALHLMLAASGIGPGDEVIVPSFTWISTANSVLYCGATPVFVDIDLQTYNISLAETLKKITPKTKAIIVVDLFGLCVDIEEFRRQIGSKILIFEDAACAAGASINGHMAGSISDAAAFSFHPRKSITTGEGGMLVTNDHLLHGVAEKMRNHGAEISEEERHKGASPYRLPEFNLLGFNYRMTDLQGAIGVEQLKKLDRFIGERDEQATYYHKNLSEISWLSLPSKPLNGIHAWQAYVMRVDHPGGTQFRNRIMENLEKEGIATRPGTHAIHLLSFYAQKFEIKQSDFPNSKIADETTMAIPLHNRLSRDDQDRVIRALKKVAIQ